MIRKLKSGEYGVLAQEGSEDGSPQKSPGRSAAVRQPRSTNVPSSFSSAIRGGRRNPLTTGTRRPAAAAAASAATSGSRSPNVRSMSPSIAATATPLRRTMRVAAEARMRSSPMMMPVRLSGSAPPMMTRRSLAAERRTSRRRSTASGRANCSPDMPVTNRPPRISPRASSRR